MNKIMVVYWSQTGNTREMAEAIGRGITEAGKQAEVVEVGNVSIEGISQAAVFAMGCPAMGSEELEEDEMEPFVQEVEKLVQGKKIVLFGSYGWGDGEWMQEWTERMKKAGAEIIGEAGIICSGTPDAEMVEKCKAAGKVMATL